MGRQAIQSTAYSRGVDVNALRTNQIAIVAITVLAFVLGSDFGVWLILALGLSLAVGAARPGYGPIQILYRRELLASGLVRPNPQPSELEPHRFAQGMGAVVLLLAAILLFSGATALGWLLARFEKKTADGANLRVLVVLEVRRQQVSLQQDVVVQEEQNVASGRNRRAIASGLRLPAVSAGI